MKRSPLRSGSPECGSADISWLLHLRHVNEVEMRHFCISVASLLGSNHSRTERPLLLCKWQGAQNEKSWGKSLALRGTLMAILGLETGHIKITNMCKIRCFECFQPKALTCGCVLQWKSGKCNPSLSDKLLRVLPLPHFVQKPRH